MQSINLESFYEHGFLLTFTYTSYPSTAKYVSLFSQPNVHKDLVRKSVRISKKNVVMRLFFFCLAHIHNQADTQWCI